MLILILLSELLFIIMLQLCQVYFPIWEETEKKNETQKRTTSYWAERWAHSESTSFVCIHNEFSIHIQLTNDEDDDDDDNDGEWRRRRHLSK